MSFRVKIIARLVGLVLLLAAFSVAYSTATASPTGVERLLLAFWSIALFLAGLSLLVPKLV